MLAGVVGSVNGHCDHDLHELLEGKSLTDVKNTTRVEH